MAGLYIHIPFCKQACHYCNFHFSTSLGAKGSIIEAIKKEISIRSDYLNDASLSSIYFGGGTPSLLETAELTEIMGTVRGVFNVADDAEITLEANPDDLTLEKLKMLSQTDINRLSIGIQSFRDVDLTFMNRAHTGDEARMVIDHALEVGFMNLSVDLIYGIPGLSMKAWLNNLQRVFDSSVNHLSSYALTVESGTALAHQIKVGEVPELSDTLAEAQFLKLVEETNSNGFEHYEISNFARSGQYAKHNTNYWRGVPYLGVGPSAHSFDGRSRAWNVANNANYLKVLSEGNIAITIEELSPIDRYNEYVMTGMRTKWGCSTEEIVALGPDFLPYFINEIQVFIKDEWVTSEDGIYRLTLKGKLFADRIASNLFWPG